MNTEAAEKALEKLRGRLQNVNIAQVSRAANVSRPTITAIRDGSCRNPGVLTVERIVEALDHLDGEPALEKSA